MTRFENPWLSVSPGDYEKHMGHPSVNQQEFLSECFRESIENHNPESILIIGCGTGSGLEHVDNAVTNHVTVIDINSEFLEVLKERYQHKLNHLEILNKDLYQHHFESEKYSFVYAGLVFEFVDPTIILKKISECLKKDGIFEFVLQLPNENLPHISSTHIDSIRKLSSIAELVDVDKFCRECKIVGVDVLKRKIKTLDSGKSFVLGSAKKSGA